MSQHDFDIINQSSGAFRIDLNLALKALASLSSGESEPATRYANMLWYHYDTDPATSILKMRNATNDAWINLFYLDQTNGQIHILDDTHVVDASGTQTGLVGDQNESAWTTGTEVIDSLVSPAKIKAAIDHFAPDSVGNSQTWQDMSGSRAADTAYENTSGKAINVAVQLGTGTTYLQVSSDGVTYLSIANGNASTTAPASAIVPNNHYYKVVGSYTRWHELR
jgi:hypothetical protein